MNKIDDGPPRINPSEVAWEVLIKWLAAHEARTVADQMNEENRLRDWFAGQALAGLLEYESNPKDAASFATDAYRFADAMIDARKAKSEGDA